MTGKFLSQGLRAPNYVYEPLSIFEKDIKKLITQIGLKRSSTYFAKKFREELMNILSTGRPNENSIHVHMAKSGINVTNGGDVITKTIRLRYVHLKGWVEEQDSFKVNTFRYHKFYNHPLYIDPGDLYRVVTLIGDVFLCCSSKNISNQSNHPIHMYWEEISSFFPFLFLGSPSLPSPPTCTPLTSARYYEINK